METTQEYGELFEVFLKADVVDQANRPIGYIVGFRDNGTDFRAYVQNARFINGEWVDFGVRQRSKSFTSQEAATSWAYRTAHERIAKIKQ